MIEITNKEVVHKRRSGTTFICNLPDWWDSRGRLAVTSGFIVIAHPEHQPMRYSEDGWVTLEIVQCQ